jgi:hypothetical protein
MNFTNESQYIIEQLILNFEDIKKNVQNKDKKRLLTGIFNGINEAAGEMSVLENSSFIKTEIKEEINKNEILDIDLFESKYVPENIKKYIIDNHNSKISFTSIINKKQITIEFFITKKELLTELSEIKVLAQKIFIVFKYLSSFSSKECCKQLKISIMRTHFKKNLPNSGHIVIGPQHANTAVTYNCKKNNSIVIFRKQEVFKTCIHELMHALGLDWYEMDESNFKDKLKGIYKIESDLNTPESYVEFWACILNTCFTSYFLCDKKLDDFILFTETLLEFERLYSLYQVGKILNFLSISYTDLYKENDISSQLRTYMYKEETNVFMYYILKTLFLYNYVDFLLFCDGINKNIINFTETQDNMNGLYNFINKFYNNPDFINDISKIYKKISKVKSKFLKKNMRLTCVELG